MRLQGKTAIITGAANGIGAVTARRFAEEGARVVVSDVDEEDGRRVESGIRRSGADCCFVKLDVRDREAVEQAVHDVRHRFQTVDILINNAGITADARLVKMTESDWDRVIDTNLKGVFNCTQAVAPGMIEQGSGRIISAASVVAHQGNFGQTNYVAAKAGVIGMTQVWARELGPKGITVNAVAPGFIDTEMARAVPKDTLRRVIEKTPLGRMGTATEVANAYLFLASDESSYVNGSVLRVDGGLVL